MNTGVENSNAPAALPVVPPKDPCEDSWWYRISFRLILGLCLFFFLFTLSAYLAMRLRGREVLAEQSDKLPREVGRKLVLQLQDHIGASEALALT